MQDPEYVRNAFARIAKNYVSANHILSLGTDILWRKKTARAVRDLKPQNLLDLATGSGDLAAEIAKTTPGLTITGADFCEPMLDVARARRIPNTTLLVADALALPFPDATFDTVTVAFGLRNMASWPAAITEMARVTSPHGHLAILDFSLPRLPGFRQAYRLYLHHILPLMAGLVTGERPAYKYLAGSIEQFPSGHAMCNLLQAHGYTTATATPLSGGIASLYIARKA